MLSMAASKESSYTLPSDAPEANRLDKQHELLRLTFQGKLILAPISSHPTSILDIGCGTSSWAIEIASKYPDTKVYGIDLGQPQPAKVPPNYTYLTGNFEEPWQFQDAQFDYIHGRFINIGMTKHHFVISEALRCLKPGGWFEMQEFVASQATSSVDSVKSWSKLYLEVAARMGRDLHAPVLWPAWLQDAGFENVQCEDFEWPLGRREGEKDERMRTIGGLALENFTNGIRGFTMGFFTRGAGWSEKRVDEYVDEVRKGLLENPGETIWPLKVIWGQKSA